MSFQAFEVSVNGKRLYTAGADDWRQIWCTLLAHRIPLELFPSLADDGAGELPHDPVIGMLLSTNLSVFVDKNPRSESPNDITKSGSYPRMDLKSGDTIQIRIIQTDSGDEPGWQNSNNRGPTAIQSLPKSDSE